MNSSRGQDEELRQRALDDCWSLTSDEVARLDAAGAPTAPYPSWHQRKFLKLMKALPAFSQ